ncbi:10025_t:CDS:1, partial [Acaulospora morrowiae]
FWCQETIKILWSEPFKLLYTCKKKQCHCSPEKRRSQAANLLLTYLSCLLHKYKDPCLQHDPTLKLPPPPLFEYIDYLKGLDLNELYSAVEDWTKISKQRPRSPVISKVFKEICYFYEGHCKDDRDVTLDY